MCIPLGGISPIDGGDVLTVSNMLRKGRGGHLDEEVLPRP